jgi:hypothetical protein
MDEITVQDREPVPAFAASRSPDKVTPAQRSYLLDLLEKKQYDDPQNKTELIVKSLRISEDPEEFGMSKQKASELIEFFKNKPNKPLTQRPLDATNANKREWPDVPAGRYAVKNQQDVLQFYTVDRPKEGKWAGYTFLSVWASDEKHPIRNSETKLLILQRIAEDPKAAAERFGQEIGACGICGRTLTDETSRAIGIGPVCREKSEWY